MQRKGRAAVLVQFKPETKCSLRGLDSTKLLGKLTNPSNLFRALKIGNGTENGLRLLERESRERVKW